MQGNNTDSLSVDLSTSDAQVADITLTSDASWLSVLPVTVSTPGTLTVAVNAAGLSSGTYTGTITADAAGLLSGVLSVTLNVIDPNSSVYSLMLSDLPERTNPVLLEGQSVTGDVYVFISPESGISQVSFYLDDPGMSGDPIQTEGVGPYDFAGTANSGLGNPYDSSQLSDGLHEITAFIELTAGGSETVSATFSKGDTTPRLMFAPASMTFNVDAGNNTDSLSVDLSTSDAQVADITLTSDASWLSVLPVTVSTPGTLTVAVNAAGLSSGTYTGTITADAAGLLSGVLSVTLNVIDPNSSVYSLMLSDLPERTNPVLLEGQSVTGDVYVFISPESGISQVSFYLDDPGMSGDPIQTEGVGPYDFAGTANSGLGNPYDSSQLSDGLHEITAFIELTAGGSETVSATFSKGDTTPRLMFAPASMTFNVDAGNNTDSLSVDLSTSDAQVADITLTSDASWLSVSPVTVTTQAATLTVTVDATNLDPGTYSGTITADAGGYLSGALSVTLNVIDPNSSNYSLMLSYSSSRVNSELLEGQSVTGDVYVFISPESGISQVSFYLDDPGMSGDPIQTEGVGPYDFAGTANSGLGNPYDSSQLSDGLHEITAFIELTAGGSETVRALFSRGVFQCPSIRLVKPKSFDLISSTDLYAAAISCADSIVFPGWGVRFRLSGEGLSSSLEIDDFEQPFEATFDDLEKSEYELTVMLIQSSGIQIPGATSEDQATPVGIGDYYVAFGDSITVGEGDDVVSDDNSLDGRNLGGGYEPILNDMMTNAPFIGYPLGYPHFFANEGVSGEQSVEALARIQSVIDKHPESQYFLILYGTNDSGGSMPVLSGWFDDGLEGRLLLPGESGYDGSFLDNMQQIIDAIIAAGKEPILARVPIALGPCGSCTHFPDPIDGAARNSLIKEYNKVIMALASAHNEITVTPPDFYNYFNSIDPDDGLFRYETQYSDNYHPNGIGYQSMAHLWFNAITE